MSYVLGGDIGGTKTDLGIFEVRGADGLALVTEERFASRDYGGLEEIVEKFLAGSGQKVDAAAFGIAGPVIDQTVQVTNLPWRIAGASLAKLLGTPKVKLLNDLAATAYGALFLSADEILVLNQGSGRKDNCVVIAAGTGLGQALLIWNGTRHQPCATEGGHGSFAPRNAEQVRLLEFLLRERDHVSIERVLSGPGLGNIFRFVDEVLNVDVAPGTRERLRDGDPGKVIGDLGLDGACPACSRVLDIFVDIYGSQAGNLALTAMGLGGVYVGGGPAVKLRARIEQGGFMRAFTAKGRFAAMMGKIPVRIILNPQTCRLGAAHVARELVEEAVRH